MLALLLLLAACAAPSPHDATEMVVAAHPLAAQAGLDMLRRGGTPIDAAVAVQAMLALVEPQASGLGGGSLLLTWDAATHRMESFDGTAAAPRETTPALTIGTDGRPLDPNEVGFGPRAVAVPGTLPVLWAVHKAQGKLPWAELFQPAIRLAEDGFPMPQALYEVLAAPGAVAAYAAAAAPYIGPDRQPVPVGAIVRNPALAATLRRVARLGPEGLTAEGAGAQFMAVLRSGPYPSLIAAPELAGTPPVERAPLCAPWRGLQLCTTPPPAYGGLVALQILAMAGTGDLGEAHFAHRFLEAGRLAEADRRRYVADPDFMPVPTAGLLDPGYLAARAALIEPDRALARALPGEPAGAVAALADPATKQAGTSEVAIVDHAGDALSMTATITLTFGARIAAEGVVLNNALINFSPAPPRNARYVNEMAPRKRPASPLAPVIVLGADDRPVLIGGGAGGAQIPETVAAVLLDVLGNGQTPAAALARGNMSTGDPAHLTIEQGTAAERLVPALRAMGHDVAVEPLPSGTALLQRTADGWRGAADPRRDGVALGD
jgi:gamma-glutamyltranspeptidase/glutathione hydrolase